MCGLAGAWGGRDPLADVRSMIAAQRHRGPDADGFWCNPDGDRQRIALGHARLAIRDLSDAGLQPMFGDLSGLDPDGRFVLCFNGEILNDAELGAELAAEGFVPRSSSDAEVLIAAWARWGPDCLDRLVGFFAFLMFDRRERVLWAVRDRFGVKPLYLHRSPDGTRLRFASEIGGLFADERVPREPDPVTWSRYLGQGRTDEGERTFWQGIERLEAGTWMRIDGRGARTHRWYDLPARLEARGGDRRDEPEVRAEVRALLEESVRLRFRSDVPVGINLSGGLDSSTLLALVHEVQGPDSDVAAFHFATGDPRYDELPWVERMLERTRHPLVPVHISPHEVPDLAARLWRHNLEPYGGLPTVAYAALFAEARRRGVLVLLDGQGIDEAWAGYDYHLRALSDTAPITDEATVPIQGAADPLRRQVLAPEFLAAAEAVPTERTPRAAIGDTTERRLLDLQLRDLLVTKLPRALRFNDRASMSASCELREPFLDHRLVELALRQPVHRKIEVRADGSPGARKAMLRDLAKELLPEALVNAPKRPVQTPQREWLRGELRDWVEAQMAAAWSAMPGWLDRAAMEREWSVFLEGGVENGFFVWQWVTLGWLAEG